MTYPAEYVPNEDRVWTVYSLMTGFSGESVVEIGADEKVYAEYGLDDPEYTVAFEYDGKAYVIFFSGLTEDGYYYASSSIVPDTVVKVAPIPRNSSPTICSSGYRRTRSDTISRRYPQSE